MHCVSSEVAAMPQQGDMRVISGAYLYAEAVPKVQFTFKWFWDGFVSQMFPFFPL